MSIKLELPDALWEELAGEAAREGISPEEHATFLLQLVTPLIRQARYAEAHGTHLDPHAAALAASYDAVRGASDTSLAKPERPTRSLVTGEKETAPVAIRDPERVARVRRVRGRLAPHPPILGSEELHRERRADKAKEDRITQGSQT